MDDYDPEEAIWADLSHITSGIDFYETESSLPKILSANQPR